MQNKFTQTLLYFIAPILGLGQSFMLIFAPTVIETKIITLSQFAFIMGLGSALFLVSTTFWGNKALQWGRKLILIKTLMAFSISFLIIITVIKYGDGLHEYLVILGLVLARIIYGLFASAIVPMCQAIISESTGYKNSIKPLSYLAISQAFFRLVGPFLGLGLLHFSIWAGLSFLVIYPLLLIVCVAYSPFDAIKFSTRNHKKITNKASNNLINNKLDKQLLGLLCISAIYTLINYLLIPYSQNWLQLTTEQTSKLITYLLASGALTMIVCHKMALLMQNYLRVIVNSSVFLLLLCSIVFMAKTLLALVVVVILTNICFALLQLHITHRLCASYQQGEKSIATALVSKYQTYGYILGAILIMLVNGNIVTGSYCLILLSVVLFVVTINSFSKVC